MKRISTYKTITNLQVLLIIIVISNLKSAAQTICTSQSGIKEGYYWELWNQNNQGTSCITLGNGCLFSCEWTGIQNSLSRRGLKYNSTLEHQEIGVFTANYSCNYNPSSASGNSYLSVYGWTMDPMVEYYIVEDWRNWIPSMADGAISMGTINVNDGTYEIIKIMRFNAPNITGVDADFPQYFSIRQSKRDSGTINITDHFEKWESLGLDLGKLYEVSFVVEGYQSSGNAEFTTLDVSVQSPTNIDNQKSSAINIYPNPGLESITIDFGHTNLNADLNVYDFSGKDILVKNDISENNIQISDLEKGLYIVLIRANDNVITQKVVVQ
jgi:endo-1,4-beta-xylanase